MEIFMDLTNAQLGTVYTVKELRTGDEELNAFLFTLGCYVGEPITVISRRKSGCTVSIKDGRYNIDKELASAILV
jgi:ferrous iron transport protein A